MMIIILDNNAIRFLGQWKSARTERLYFDFRAPTGGLRSGKFWSPFTLVAFVLEQTNLSR